MPMSGSPGASTSRTTGAGPTRRARHGSGPRRSTAPDSWRCSGGGIRTFAVDRGSRLARRTRSGARHAGRPAQRACPGVPVRRQRGAARPCCAPIRTSRAGSRRGAPPDRQFAGRAGIGRSRRADRRGNGRGFQELNRTYVERHGFPFIIAVRDHDRAGILQAFETRIDNDRDTEIREACRQVERIAGLRIREIMERDTP